MPIYYFKNPKTGEVKEIIQSMNENHEYEANGVKWEREFTVPNSSIDTIWDPMNSKDFVEKTRTKKGTMGDLYDKSRELSAERERIVGTDKTKEAHFKRYEKDTGKKHPHRDRKKEVKIDFAKGKVL